jgi:alpha-tubulin suppressor-like RCC1 family protein
MKRMATVAALAIGLVLGCSSSNGGGATGGDASPAGSDADGGSAAPAADGGPGTPASGDGGIGTYCYYATNDDCTSVGASVCAQSGGTTVSACPTASLLGCCTSTATVAPTVGDVNCYYAAPGFTEAAAMRSCTGSGSTWSTSLPGTGTAGDAGLLAMPQGAAQSVATGGSSACAVDATGAVFCWGSDYYGVLGTSQHLTTCTEGGTYGSCSRTPIPIAGLSNGATAVVLGDDSACALMSGGSVECWGGWGAGQLGSNATPSYTACGGVGCVPTPAMVTGLSGAASAISAGDNSVCALVAGGGIQCWGDNTYGQLGNGTPSDNGVGSPVSVTNLSGAATAVSVGGGSACAIVSGGAVECWGALGSSLGTMTCYNSTPCTPSPVALSGLSGVTAISVDRGVACAITAGGGLECWGDNTYGQLGDGTTTSRTVAAAVPGLSSGVTAVSVGADSVCAVVSGAVECWGNATDMWTGNATCGSGSGSPCALSQVAIPGLGSGIAGLAPGDGSPCALTSSGKVECWGYNTAGELGNGADAGRAVTSMTPLEVTGF